MSLTICPDRQRILDAAGHVLVTGGPGSGKTTIALVKALRRIEAGFSPGQSVLFLSFSRAAVARIVEASKTQVPEESRSLLSIQTFHSFFWEILRGNGYLLGAPRRLELLLPHDEKARRDGIKEREDDPAWQAWLRERERLFMEEGLVAFDLFAPKAAEILGRGERIRNLLADRYPLIIVDEAQDTGDAQWACIRELAARSQMLCLADLEQQIFDFLPGVGPERIAQIAQALQPERIDLGSQNNRSPGSEIAQFANDILNSLPRGAPYKGISQRNYQPRAENRDLAIRQSVGALCRRIRQEAGVPPTSIALLAASGRGVAVISRALRSGAKEIPHKVYFDEAEVLLASRFAAFCLEPKQPAHRLEDLALGLEMIAALFRAKGGKGALADAARLGTWTTSLRQGQMPAKAALVKEIVRIFTILHEHSFTGDPRIDWLYVRRLLRESANRQVQGIEKGLEYLMAFNRGKRIASELGAMWMAEGGYAHARDALDAALAEDQILSAEEQLRGIHVMTIHKSKGKEFDGVLVFREEHVSPFVWQGDTAPYIRSRKILRVGITRARHHVLVLNTVHPPCPLLAGHVL